MSKRKRDDDDDAPLQNIDDRAVRIKASRLRVKVIQGEKSLVGALKLARGFERQKLGRRQKQAATEPQKLLRLREEVIVLKELDIAKTAKNQLFKHMSKTKRIKESAAFTALYGDVGKSEGPATTAEANVVARLFKSAPVMKALPEAMGEITAVLRLKKPSSSVPLQSPDRDRPVEGGGDFKGFSSRSQSEESAEGFIEQLNEDSTNENGDRSTRPLVLHRDEMSISASATSELSHSDDSGAETMDIDSLLPPSRQKSVQPVSKTAFLPSLSMGGYYSGSESEDGGDGGDGYSSGAKLQPERKNRRGQRARQQIAEKKYGDKAKHLLRQKRRQNDSQKDKRSEGWDTRRGAVEAKSIRARNTTHLGELQKNSRDNSTRSSENTSTRRGVEQNSGNQDGPLHPSWEAAKKKKMERNHLDAFAGKKITFD